MSLNAPDAAQEPATAFVTADAGQCAPAGRLEVGASELAGGLPQPGGAAWGFQWYDYFGGLELSSIEQVHLSFDIIPFSSGSTLVGLDEIGGRTAIALSFEGGLINQRVAYRADAWNQVNLRIDFGDATSTLSVNGAPSEVIPFSFADTSSLQALRVHAFNARAGGLAWLRAVVLTRGDTVSHAHPLDKTEAATDFSTSTSPGSLTIGCSP